MSEPQDLNAHRRFGGWTLERPPRRPPVETSPVTAGDQTSPPLPVSVSIPWRIFQALVVTILPLAAFGAGSSGSPAGRQ